MTGDPSGFLKIKRDEAPHRHIEERVKDYKEVSVLRTEEHTKAQAQRCMDCGIPFCQSGCPVENIIPEWNNQTYKNKWDSAYELLNSTNSLPEITGRVCPAPCEAACVLGINEDPVTIRENELDIIEHAFKSGQVVPRPPKTRSGQKVAVVGSGPAGMACADFLNRLGHTVTLFERDDKLGGIMRYGIPDFKLEKHVLDRKVEIWKKEGIVFKTNSDIREMPEGFDAVCLTGGSRQARNIPIPGRDLKGIHLAMDYLTQSNRRVAGESIPADQAMFAKGKHVVVIGGGDTGSDCVGTANRQSPLSVTQIEIMPKPPVGRSTAFPWPKYPMMLRTSSSQEEAGVQRQWSVLTKGFAGENGTVKKLLCVKADAQLKEIPGTEFELPAELVLLALGFLHPEHDGLLTHLGLELDARGNVKANSKYMTSREGVFAAGDMRRGQSLIVWALYEGREAAKGIHEYLFAKVSATSGLAAKAAARTV